MEQREAKTQFFFQEFVHVSSEKWRELLSYVLNKANAVEFVIKSRDELHPSLEPFRFSLIKTTASRWRWGAKQPGTTFYARFALSDALKEYLLKPPTLGEWSCDLPEDPSLYVDDEVIMWTISHEQLAFVRFSEREVSEFNKMGFSLERAEGVSLPYPPSES